MARNSTTIRIVVHEPATESSRQELAERTAAIHADCVRQFLKNLNCPQAQKQILWNRILAHLANQA